jgi:hypothetical protein
MLGFERNEWIALGPEDVFVFLTDAGNASKSMPKTKEMKKLTEGQVAVGTRYRETRLMHGREEQVELEVVRYEPPRFYSMRNITAGIETTYHYRCESEREGTRVHLSCDLRARGIRRVLLPLVAWELKKEDGQHLQQLKAALENSAWVKAS